MASEVTTSRRRTVVTLDNAQVEIKSYDTPRTRGVQLIVPSNLDLNVWDARTLGHALLDAADWAANQ